KLSAGRLAKHRRKIGAEYTIVVTPIYVPAVLEDIKSFPIVIIRSSTFAEYLYNHIDNKVREIDYEDFDKIISNNFGEDISRKISNLTLEKFSIKQ
ncbi:MAG: restriction endonuclease, partial [Candidatus Paceibacterota bacterium]